MSLVAPGNGYQPFVVPASMAGKLLTEKATEGGQSGAGVGLTEKDIDERVGVSCFCDRVLPNSDVWCRSRKLWKLQ